MNWMALLHHAHEYQDAARAVQIYRDESFIDWWLENMASNRGKFYDIILWADDLWELVYYERGEA